MSRTDDGAQRGAAHATLVVPTRNESDNVEEFARRLSVAMSGMAFGYDVVFADDSDDDTPARISALQEQGFPVVCAHRGPGERQGSIAGAVADAMAVVRGPIVVIIDADLQHPPEIVSCLVAPIHDGTAHVTVGTRYAGGGSAIGLGTLRRRATSRAAGLATKSAFPHLWRCTDLSSGLFAFDRRRLAFDQVNTEGFKLLTEVLIASDARAVVEVPYVFEARVGGVSKARLRDGLVLLRQLVRQRMHCRRMLPISVHRAPAHGGRDVEEVIDLRGGRIEIVG